MFPNYWGWWQHPLQLTTTYHSYLASLKPTPLYHCEDASYLKTISQWHKIPRAESMKEKKSFFEGEWAALFLHFCMRKAVHMVPWWFSGPNGDSLSARSVKQCKDIIMQCCLHPISPKYPGHKGSDRKKGKNTEKKPCVKIKDQEIE